MLPELGESDNVFLLAVAFDGCVSTGCPGRQEESCVTFASDEMKKSV